MEEQNIAIGVKDTIIHNIDLVFVGKGSFKKGLDCRIDTISYGYWIGKFEITNKQFYQFLIKGIKDSIIIKKQGSLYCHYKGDELVPEGDYCVKPFDDRIFLRNDSIVLDSVYANHPLTAVTWYGAKAFCDHYNLDLPNEKEWEKAARGMHSYWFPWGNEINGTYANYYNSGDPFEPGTTPVGFYNGKTYNGFKTENASSVYGCYDMSGNAWEWLSDFAEKKVPYHSGKGGGFNYHTPAFLQVYYVSSFGPGKPPAMEMCNRTDGFRVVKRIHE